MLLWGAAALFFVFLAIAFLALLILIAFWDDHRLLVAALLAALVPGPGSGRRLCGAETDRGQASPVRRQPERAGQGPRRTHARAMRTHMKDLALRRQTLLAQAAEQRRVAAEATADLRRGLASVERAVGILRYLGRKPLVVAYCSGRCRFARREAPSSSDLAWLRRSRPTRCSGALRRVLLSRSAPN